MDLPVISTCALIILARIADVSLGTLRTISVVNGRALVSWILGFFEVLIWIFAVSQIFRHLDNPIYAVAYAFGFATGNYVGVRVEGLLAFGEQVVRVFTRQGLALASTLRDAGYRVTEFDGRGRDGAVALLFIEVKRREAQRVLRRVHDSDPGSFCLVDDVRFVKTARGERFEPTGWRSIFKVK